MARAGRVDSTTVFHHILAPIAIFCSTRTRVDFRTLCHLMFVIDISGAIVSAGKLYMRFGGRRRRTYKVMAIVYSVARVPCAYVDTAIITWSLFKEGYSLDGFVQLYIEVMLLLNALNAYFAHLL